MSNFGKCLLCIPFDGECRFGTSLDSFIEALQMPLQKNLPFYTRKGNVRLRLQNLFLYQRYSSVYSYSQGSLYHCQHLCEASCDIVMQKIFYTNTTLSWGLGPSFSPRWFLSFTLTGTLHFHLSTPAHPKENVTGGPNCLILSLFCGFFQTNYFDLSWVSCKGQPATHSTIS